MNIHHFSSLADILIDTESLSYHDYNSHDNHAEHEHEHHDQLPSVSVSGMSSFHEKYEEESFEQESHAKDLLHVPSTYSQDYTFEEEENNQYDENTFEETGLTLPSHDEKKYQHHEQEDDEEHYENTFENDYSKSFAGKNSPCPSIERKSPTTTSPKVLSDVFGSMMSGIKATENIKTLEDLAILSTPSNSSPSSPRVDSFGHDPAVQTPLFVQPPRMKVHALAPSSESTGRRPITPSMVRRPEIHESPRSFAPKLFSKVQYVSKESIEKERKSAGKSRKLTNLSKQSNQCVEPWNLTSEDLETMKKAKAVLDRMESQQKAIEEMQIHRMAARKAVVVQNLDLGRNRQQIQRSSSPSDEDSLRLNEPYSMRSDDSARRGETASIGLEDDDGTYPSTLNDEMSLESILTCESNDHGPHRTPKVGLTAAYKNRKGSQPKGSRDILIRSANSRPCDEAELSNQRYLEDLAEQTYFNFLSDVMNAARSKSLTASLEELAMHRIISERLYAYFSQPNQTKLLRHDMIRAAKEVQDSLPNTTRKM